MRDQQGFADFAAARGDELRRQAYLLTGSPERAGRLADRALADTQRRWDGLGGPVAAEEHARRLVATGALRGRGARQAVATTAVGTAAPTDDSGEAVRRALAGLPARRRAVLVLRYDEGLDDTAAGARLGVPAATAAAEAEAALATLRSLLRRRGRPEDLLRPALAEVRTPDRVAGDRQARRSPRRRWALAAAVVVVAGIAAGVLVPALRNGSAGTTDSPVPASAANGPGQLPWPARGPLAADPEVLRSALRAWQAGVPERQRPTRAAALWAGQLDGATRVLLQGTDAGGQSWVADVVGTGQTASLRSAEPLGRAVPLVAVGTSAGAVRLLAAPDTAPGSLLALVGRTLQPLAVTGDELSQGVTAPPAGLRVALTDGRAVVGSGTVLPDRLSPVTGTVELTRSTLGFGPAQPPAPVWYDDGQLLARRLGGPVAVVQVGPTRSTTIKVGARRSGLEARGYEVVRAGTRYLATVVRVGGAPACTDTASAGPADATPARPVVLVARCIPRGAVDGVLAAVATGGVRSVRVTVPPAAPAGRGHPGRARVVAIGGMSGTGLVGLTGVPALGARTAPAVALGAGNRAVARLTLAVYRGPRP